MAWRHGSMGCSGVEAVPPPQQPAAVRIPDSCSAAVRCVIVLGVEGGVGRSGWACTDRSGREAAAPHSPAPRPCPTQEEAAVVTGQEDPEAAAVAVLSSPGSRGQWCVLNSLRSWFRANPQAVCVRGLSHHCCPESSLTAFCAMLCALCCSCAVWATRPEPTQWHTHTHVHTRTHTGVWSSWEQPVRCCAAGKRTGHHSHSTGLRGIRCGRACSCGGGAVWCPLHTSWA